MADRFPVLLVDDGELDDVRDCLLALGADFAHLRGGAVPAKLEPPRDLFIASTRHTALAKPWPKPNALGRPVRIAVVSEDSGTLRATLRRLGFSFLVRRPVHPVALRLLLMHALYQGEERRRAPRVPLGYKVAVKIGLRRREALLVDLSQNGCRLLVNDPITDDAKVTVQVPTELCGDDAFALPGRVLRCARDHSSPTDGSHAVAIRFGRLDEAAQSLLEEALAAHRLGTGTLAEPTVEAEPVLAADGSERAARIVTRVAPRAHPPAAPRSRTPSTGERRRVPQAADAPKSPHGVVGDRRRHARRRYARRVIAAVPDGSLHRVLIGRDLSPGGMRIDRQPDLRVGATLRIALYDAAREAPVVVTARVERDDGAKGMALRFEAIAPDLTGRVEELVATLPPVECLQDGETNSLGTVIGEILK